MGREQKLVTPYEHANAIESSLYQPKDIFSVALTVSLSLTRTKGHGNSLGVMMQSLQLLESL